MPNAKNLGHRIQRLRKEADLTQEELAAEIGVSRPTIANIEVGRDLPSLLTLEALAAFFSTPMDQLCRGVSAPTSPRRGEVIKDPDELALVHFWRGLSHEQRELVVKLLAVPAKTEPGAH